MVRQAGSDLERPPTITVTEAPRRSSPPSATAISAAVSHSSSHARRVGRSLVGEGEGVRWRRPPGAPWGSWSWVELLGACSNDPHDSEVRSAPNDYKRHLLANCTAFAPASCLRNQLEPRGFRSPLFFRRPQLAHWVEPDGAPLPEMT
jgi:hypothetical protein